MIALFGLFTAALLAATLLPAQSETVLAALILQGNHPVALLLAVATAGNVLGSLVNWALGRAILRWQNHPRFLVNPARLARAQVWYGRYGWPLLLASWVPVVGDPITLAAGALREPLWRFLAVVTLAKGGRYVAVAAATLQLA